MKEENQKMLSWESSEYNVSKREFSPGSKDIDVSNTANKLG